jgi:hypothetical protein
VNVFPAIDKITLSGGKAVLTPVLMGNASATDLTTNMKVSLNEIDPDSMTVDSKGQLVLVNQAGNELVFLKNPGTPQQQVSRIPVGDQLDDTVWATSNVGRLLVVDASGKTVWISTTQFIPGTIYTEGPSDSGVGGFVGVVDPSTGFHHANSDRVRQPHRHALRTKQLRYTSFLRSTKRPGYRLLPLAWPFCTPQTWKAYPKGKFTFA